MFGIIPLPLRPATPPPTAAAADPTLKHFPEATCDTMLTTAPVTAPTAAPKSLLVQTRRLMLDVDHAPLAGTKRAYLFAPSHVNIRYSGAPQRSQVFPTKNFRRLNARSRSPS